MSCSMEYMTSKTLLFLVIQQNSLVLFLQLLVFKAFITQREIMLNIILQLSRTLSILHSTPNISNSTYPWMQTDYFFNLFLSHAGYYWQRPPELQQIGQNYNRKEIVYISGRCVLFCVSLLSVSGHPLVYVFSTVA